MDKLLDRIGEDFLHWVLWMFTFIMIRYGVDYFLRLFGSQSNILIDIFLSFVAFVIASYLELLGEGKLKTANKSEEKPIEDTKTNPEIKK